MKMFSDCSGECCLCGAGQGCLAGHGDDDFYSASKEQIIERLDKGQFPSYRQMMIDHLKRAFNYDYHGYIDTDNCAKIDPREEMNKRFGNPYKNFLHGGIVNEFCCENRNKEDNIFMFINTLDDMLKCIGSPLVENGKSVSDKPLYQSEDIKSNIDSHTLNQQFGEAITNFLDGLQQNNGLCCHDKSKEDNMKKYSITECRECKYKVTTKDGEYNPDDIVCSYWMSDGLTEDDYCSRGVEGKYEGNNTDICKKLSCETCKWGDKYEFDGENWDYMCTIPYSYMTGRVMPRNHACARWTKKDIND